MQRRTRNDVEGAWQHLVNRGAARQAIFRTRSDAERFEALLGSSAALYGVEIHAYCLMTNHFHLLVHAPAGGIGTLMHRLQGTYSGWFNRRYGRDGGLFRGRYRARTIDTVEYRTAAGRYIHRNPLDIRASPPLDEYRWSSMRYYAGADPNPPWLHTDVLLRPFTSRQTYGEFVGDDDAAFADAQTLLGIVHAVVGDCGPVGTSRASDVTRLVVSLLLGRCTAPVAAELRAWLAFPSATVERATRERALSLAASDPTFAAIVARVA